LLLYVGNNQHKGSSSKPREFAIDDLIIPQPPAEEFIRVQVKFVVFIIYYNNIINCPKTTILDSTTKNHYVKTLFPFCVR